MAKDRSVRRGGAKPTDPPPVAEKESARKRAHNPDGTFKADDPSTPDINEAWEPVQSDLSGLDELEEKNPPPKDNLLFDLFEDDRSNTPI